MVVYIDKSINITKSKYDIEEPIFVLTEPDGTLIDNFDTEESAHAFAEYRVDHEQFDCVQCRTGIWHNQLKDDHTFLVDNISDEVLWEYPER